MGWFGLASVVAIAWSVGCSDTPKEDVGPSDDAGNANDAETTRDAGENGASKDAGEADAAIDAAAGTSDASKAPKFVGAPTITTHGGVDNFVVARTDDGRTWFKKPGAPGPEWSAWIEASSLARLGESPDLAAWSGERLDVIARGPCGPNGEVRACQAFAVRDVVKGTLTWSTLYDLGAGPGTWQGSFALSSPLASRLAAQGIGSDGNVYDSFWNGGAWSAWTAGPAHPTLVGAPDAASWTIDLAGQRIVTIIAALTSTNGLAVLFNARNLDGSQLGWSTYSTPTPPEALTGDPAVLRRTNVDASMIYVRAQSGRLLRVPVTLNLQTEQLEFGSWHDVTLAPGLTSVLHVDCATSSYATVDTDHCVALGSDGAVWTFKTNAPIAPPAGAISPVWGSLGATP